MVIIAQDILYKRLSNGTVEPVMAFLGGKPYFKDVQFGSYFGLFPLPHPNGPQNRTISLPEKGSSPEQFKAYQAAFKHHIRTSATYKNYFWETRTIVSKKNS